MAKSENIAHRVSRFWRMANYIIRNARRNYTQELHAQANRERRKILDDIAAGDAERAEHLMEEHISGKPRRVGLLGRTQCDLDHAVEPKARTGSG